MSKILGRLMAAALLFAATPAAAQYVAETGRSEKPQLSTAPAGPNQASPAPMGPPVEVKDEAFEAALESALVGQVAIQVDGINKSLKTFADVRLHEITGSKRFNKQEPLATIVSMVYQQPMWLEVPLIPVDHPNLAKAFGLDDTRRNRVSPLWLMQTPRARQVVLASTTGGEEADKALGFDAATMKALNKMRFRLFAFYNLPTDFKVVPLEGGGGAWVAPALLKDSSSVQDTVVARRLGEISAGSEPYASALVFDVALRDAVVSRKYDDLAPAAARLIRESGSAPGAMPDYLRRLDYWNTIIHPFAKAALLFAGAFFAFLVYSYTARGQRGPGAPAAAAQVEAGEVPVMSAAPALAFAGVAVDAPRVLLANRAGTQAIADSLDSTQDMGSKPVWWLAMGIFSLATVTMITALVARFFLGGRMPVTNLYESLVFAMGAFAIVGLVFEAIYRQGWIGWSAALGGWLVMVWANGLPLQMRKVDPLVAVLDSPWLNYHVTSLLISYSLFFIAFLFGILYFVRDFAGQRVAAFLPDGEILEYLIYRAIQVGWPLLTLGIFLGAVWANTAWGNAWSWDPKETWALITWLTYTIYLHFRMILGWNGRRAVSASLLGFGMVLITYFGVNYLPGLSGGMHSYAEPIAR